MPGLFMSTRKYVSPRCLGAAGSVRARQIAQSASWASEVHTFCPVSRQPPLDPRSARVRNAARSEPASGSLNSWHQLMSPRSVGPDEPVPLGRGAVLHDGRPGPAADDQVGPGQPGPASSSSMRSCVGRRGATPVGRRASAARRSPASASAAGAARAAGSAATSGHRGRPAHRPLAGSASGRRSDARGRRRAPAGGQAAQPARRRQRRDPPSSWRSASARRRYRCASCSQVKPMPPSTWMQSLAFPPPRPAPPQRRPPRPAGAPPAPRPPARAASQATAAARSARQSIPAHRCLTAWNEPIGRPNCCRVRAYSAAVSQHHLATPAASTRPASRPGRGRRGAQPGERRRRERRPHVQRDAGQRRGRSPPAAGQQGHPGDRPGEEPTASAPCRRVSGLRRAADARCCRAPSTGPVSPLTRSVPSGSQAPVSSRAQRDRHGPGPRPAPAAVPCRRGSAWPRPAAARPAGSA